MCQCAWSIARCVVCCVCGVLVGCVGCVPLVVFAATAPAQSVLLMLYYAIICRWLLVFALLWATRAVRMHAHSFGAHVMIVHGASKGRV